MDPPGDKVDLLHAVKEDRDILRQRHKEVQLCWSYLA